MIRRPGRGKWRRRLAVALCALACAAAAAAAERAELVIQLTHAGAVSAMALSGDGALLASAGWDNTVRLWDAPGARQLRSIAVPQVVQALALSQDGARLLTGARDGGVQLWDSATGRSLRSLPGHQGVVRAVAVSADGRWFASGGSDRVVRVWDAVADTAGVVLEDFRSDIVTLAFTADGERLLIASHLGAEIRALPGGGRVVAFADHEAGVTAADLTPDGRLAATASLDGTARLWDAGRGTELQRFSGHGGKSVTAVAISADAARVISAGKDHTLQAWRVADGAVDRVLALPARALAARLLAAPDPDRVYAAVGDAAEAWQLSGARRLQRFAGSTDMASSLAFAPDGSRLLVGNWDDSAAVWDLRSGVLARRLLGHQGDVRAVAVSPDGALGLTGGRDEARLWHLGSGALLHRFAALGGVRPVAFAPDGARIAIGGDDGRLTLWSAQPPYALQRTLGPLPGRVAWAAFDAAGRRLVGASGNGLWLWDLQGDAPPVELAGHQRPVNYAVFAPRRDELASAGWDGAARIWNLADGSERLRLAADPAGVISLAYSPDGRLLATGGQSGTIRLWDSATGASRGRLDGHAGGVIMLAFTPDGRFLVSSGQDQSVGLWDLARETRLARLVAFSDGDWAVVDQLGRYDAANGGDVQGLHWVVGTEPLALAQLKQDYYDPGLLAKLLGHNAEPLRPVDGFVQPRLHPEVEIAPIVAADPRLRLRLRNRGGGIGPVSILVNGREIAQDARAPGADPAAAELSLDVPLGDHPYLLPGQQNRVEVRARNADGSLVSRGVVEVFTPGGAAAAQRPTLWAIVVGVSDYADDRLDLRYAAKDARDMAAALQLGGAGFAAIERVDLQLLASGAEGAGEPTKAALQQAFARVREARPWDLLVVYLAGHGVARDDEYYFLPRDAGAAAVDDPAERARTAVSSAELIGWLRGVAALKQVIVLDTCAAGQAAAGLVAERSVPSDQLRALERLKDRTGFHVLMGSAADAVSYEATRFEQGLLTYALLQGMRGPALREEQYVDVSQWFQYAVDEVPQLAQHIGGIQRPRIAAPRGSSFDIGRLGAAERERIPWYAPKPLLLHPVLLNATLLLDDLGLAARLRQRLRDASYAAARNQAPALPLVYVNAPELAGAIRPSGTYTVTEGAVEVRLVLARNGQVLRELRVAGALGDLDALVRDLEAAIVTAAADLPAAP